MVGWTVIRRMQKHHLTQVSSVWTHGNYAHSHMSTSTSVRIAESILNGSASDISQGATYFYSPNSMPKEGETPSSRTDVRGGLESVPGVKKNGRTVRNHIPSWAKVAYRVRVPGIQDEDFKFFRP